MNDFFFRRKEVTEMTRSKEEEVRNDLIDDDDLARYSFIVLIKCD